MTFYHLDSAYVQLSNTSSNTEIHAGLGFSLNSDAVRPVYIKYVFDADFCVGGTSPKKSDPCPIGHLARLLCLSDAYTQNYPSLAVADQSAEPKARRPPHPRSFNLHDSNSTAHHDVLNMMLHSSKPRESLFCRGSLGAAAGGNMQKLGRL
eukprot:363577-Chlamydomonas_euryale.AAC.9